MAASKAKNMAREVSRSAVVFDVAENSRDSIMIVATSASAAAVITSCPKGVRSWPASLSSGSSSPAEVEVSTTARKTGLAPAPARLSTKPQARPSSTEPPNAQLASRPSGPRRLSTSISRPARKSSMPRPRSLST